MKAEKLYAMLEKDFVKKGIEDKWYPYMGAEIREFISESFKKRSIGLVCDFADEISKVYTAVFPSGKVMEYVLKQNEKDIMLFVHHAATWDIRIPETWRQMSRELLQKFRENRISIYNFHVPLDNFGEYSTGTAFAEALNLKVEKKFGEHNNSYSGVICKTELNTIQELKESFEKAVNHKVKLYKYGTDAIKNQKVGIVTGGGNKSEYYEELSAEGVNTFLTGISVKNDYSEKTHKFAEQKKINILGGTHYSTEKFACIKMCDYFRKLGLKSEFIKEKPVLEDM